MGFLGRLFGRRKRDPEAERRAILTSIENVMARVDFTIKLPASGHPKCPSCGARHPITVEKMRVAMTPEDGIRMIICEECGARIRVIE